MTALALIATPTARPVLRVQVVTRGDEHVPRLAYEYGADHEPADLYADMHDLTARAWRASRGRGWDVRPVHGYDARGRLYAGCELALDSQTWEAAYAGREVLESVLRGVLEGGR